MGIAQDVKDLQEQMKTVMELLKSPNKNTKLVLYLIETIQTIENVNQDLSIKWNTVQAYLQNKQLVPEYNEWVLKLESIENPQMKQLFVMQPIDAKKTPQETAPELCSMESPFHAKVKCFDQKGHTGEEHIGVDENGKMFSWTKDKDLGEIDTVKVPETPQSELPEETPIAPLGDGEEEPEEEPQEDELSPPDN